MSIFDIFKPKKNNEKERYEAAKAKAEKILNSFPQPPEAIAKEIEDNAQKFKTEFDPNVYHEDITEMLGFSELPYSFRNVPYVNNIYHTGKIYLLEGENQKQAEKDILSLNGQITNANKLANIRLNKITSVHFATENYQKKPYVQEDFTRLELGLIAKYPLTISFKTQPYNSPSLPNDIFGKIFYLNSGTVGKAEFAVHKGNKIFWIECGIKDSGLQVLRVNTFDGAKKVYLYKYNSK